jgi:hypothetical protein
MGDQRTQSSAGQVVAVGPACAAMPPFDGAHPVRLALVLDVVDLLQRHGYQRIASGRSFARFLRLLNALVSSYEAGR